MASPLALGLLASGSGTNLQAIIDAIEKGALAATIRIVFSNTPDCPAVERARRHGIPTATRSHRDAATREAFDLHVVELLRNGGVELVVLAGYNRIVSPAFVRAFPDRIINIHPALLPAFPGLHAQRQALEHGARISGATVHVVDEELDHGPILIQAAVPVYSNDTEETLQERILVQEHRIYPEAIRMFAEGRLRIEGRRMIVSSPLPSPSDALVNPKCG